MRLFVYGTLKRGGSNYARHLGGASFEGLAYVTGRLWVHADGIPVLRVAPEALVAPGTGDLDADLATEAAAGATEAAARAPLPPFLADATGCYPVHGELFSLPDPPDQLPRIDALEGFVPGGGGEYERALLRVEGPVGATVAWGYLAAPWDASARELTNGVYPVDAAPGAG